MVKQKNNGFSHGDRVDMTNLLDSSESDVEWLNLPPIKGKKPKRKKTSKQRDVAGGCSCGIWSVAKPALYLTVIGAFVLLIITTVWLTAQVSDLRARLDKFESKSVVSIEDIQKLNSLVSSLNKTLEQQAKQASLAQLNISSVNTTVSKLSAEVERLGDGLKSAPELKQLPEKLQAVSKSLASLGSDVTGMKDTVAGLQTSVKDTDTRVTTLTQQIHTLNQTAGTEKEAATSLSPEIANLIQSIPVKLQDMNNTLSAKVSLIMKSLSQHEERFIQLENITEILRQNLTALLSDHTSIANEHGNMANLLKSDKFKIAVTDLVSKLNLTSGSTENGDAASSADSLAVSTVLVTIKDTLDRIQVRYDNITTKVQKNGQDIDDIKQTFVPVVMFNTFGEGYEATIQDLNETLQELKATFNSNNDIHPDKTVTKAPSESKIPVASHTEPPKVTTKAPATGAASKTEEAVAPTKETSSGTETTASTQTQQPDTTKKHTSGTDTSSDHITIPGIGTANELSSEFPKWDRSGSGKVSADILPDFLGRDAPSEQELKPYDEDHDGFYTIFEMAKALGISPDSSFDDFNPGREG